MRFLRDIGTAFGLMTLVVVPESASERPSSRTAAWFPWVGVLLGGISLAVLVSANAASVAFSDGGLLARAAGPIAVLVVGVQAVLTRLLHWDGLADVGDAWWGGMSHARRLEIMADSSVGAFGVTAVVLFAAAQITSIATLLAHTGLGIAIFAAPVFARMAATFGAWLGSPARPGGLGAAVTGTPRPADIAVATAALAIAAVSMRYEHGLTGWAWSAGAFLVAAAVPHVTAMRFGGVTGDVLGASVVVTETALLMAAALVVSW